MNLNWSCCHVRLSMRSILITSVRSRASFVKTHITFFKILLIRLNFIENLINFLDNQVFSNLMLHACGESFLTHRHRCFWITWVYFLHDYVCNRIEHLRLSQALSLTYDSLNGLSYILIWSLFELHVHSSLGASLISHNVSILYVQIIVVLIKSNFWRTGCSSELDMIAFLLILFLFQSTEWIDVAWSSYSRELPFTLAS